MDVKYDHLCGGWKCDTFCDIGYDYVHWILIIEELDVDHINP